MDDFGLPLGLLHAILVIGVDIALLVALLGINRRSPLVRARATLASSMLLITALGVSTVVLWLWSDAGLRDARIPLAFGAVVVAAFAMWWRGAGWVLSIACAPPAIAFLVVVHVPLSWYMLSGAFWPVSPQVAQVLFLVNYVAAVTAAVLGRRGRPRRVAG